jgi:ATP phosphoribosyltransferase
MNVKIALPNKGRLYEPTLALLTKAGLILTEQDERVLVARTVDPEVTAIFIRAADIPRFVESGAADLGVTGYDYIVESRARVVELLDLEYGRSKIVIAAHEKTGITTVGEIRPEMKIATKLVNITHDYLRSKAREAIIIRISGAAEIMPHIGVSDLVVDTTSTGTTLKAQGLQVIDEILESTSRLIANKGSLLRKESKVRELVTAVESVVRATKKKLIMMNVPEARLQNVIEEIPSMGGPTLAKVESPTPMWEVYSVVEEKEVYKIISSVKKVGARDIIVLPIERIIP